jgi:hypothetical protein
MIVIKRGKYLKSIGYMDPPGSEKTKLSQDSLKTYDLIKNKTSSTLDFAVTKRLYMRMLQTMRD